MYTTRYKAARHAYRRRKQATTHKHAGSRATNPNTLFQALCLRRPFWEERVKPPPLFVFIFTRLTFSRAAVLVCADIYPGMIPCGSSPYGMADITIVGCLAHLCHPEHG